MTKKLVETKILFATDLHGSETYFLKVLSAAKSFNANILIISGDLTGKAIAPIVKIDDNRYVTTFFGRDYRIGEDELPALQKDIRKVGYYYFLCSRKEYEDFKADPQRIDRLFDRMMQDTVLGWIHKIEEVLPKDLRVIMNPGNDDSFVVDEALKRSQRSEYTIGRAVDLDDVHPMVSCEWVNPTPWNSPRECSEQELEKKLRTEIGRVSDTSHLVCDFHTPPIDTPLDLAPKLGKNLQPKQFLGQPVYEHVGSKAVRNVLEEFQPKLGLHGHIHESAGMCKIRNTTCLNPGSEYIEGIMHGYLLTLTPDKVDYQPIMGG